MMSFSTIFFLNTICFFKWTCMYNIVCSSNQDIFVGWWFQNSFRVDQNALFLHLERPCKSNNHQRYPAGVSRMALRHLEKRRATNSRSLRIDPFVYIQTVCSLSPIYSCMTRVTASVSDVMVTFGQHMYAGPTCQERDAVNVQLTPRSLSGLGTPSVKTDRAGSESR